MRRIRWLVVAVATPALCTVLAAVPAPADPATATVATDAAVAAQGADVVVFTKGEAGYGCFRIPAIVRTGDGELLAFAEARRASGCGDDGHNDLVLKRSNDNGRTWREFKVIGTGTNQDWSNPVAILDPESQRITLLSVLGPADTNRPRDPQVQHSDDGGRTWSDPRSLTSDLSEIGDWGHFAIGPGGGIRLERGAHAGRLVAGVNFSVSAGNGAGLIYSDDGGATWEIGAKDVVTERPIIPQELSLFEQTDGGVYAAARDQGNADPAKPTRAYAISGDGGETFEAPFASATDLPGTVKVQGAVERLRATDHGDQYNRVLFSAPTHGELRKDMVIRSTYDEGRTWQTIGDGKLVTSERAGYSDMEILQSGEVGLLYERGNYPDGDARDTIRFASFTEADLGLPDNYAGTRTPDASGQENNGILRSGATLHDGGRFGKAVVLDGSDDHVHLPFAESLAVGPGDFTFTTWIRYGSASARQAIFWAYGQGTDRSQVWLRAEPADDRIRGWVQSRGESALVDSPRSYADSAWHHLALQRADGQVRLFVDGAQAATAKAPAGSVSPARPFRMYLGQRLDGEHHFAGRLDEARLYRRALSAAEISALHSSNAPVADGLAFRLSFDVLS